MRFLTGLFIVLLFSLQPVSVQGDDASDRRALEEALNALERKDFKRGLQIIKPMAEKGHPFAQWVLGDMFKDGEGVAKDIGAARSWWMQAASKGLDAAEVSLGDSYATGIGGIEDWKEATKWWRRAAEKGNARAQTGLALALYDGKGLPRDRAEAAKWFQKAANAGEVQSQAMLGQMFLLGEGGLRASFVDAYKWVLLAGEEGKPLTAKTKAILEASLRPTDRQEAIRLAEQWKFENGKVKTPPPPPIRDEEVPIAYFVNSTALSSKCSSTVPSDLAWCDAYIAGVIDTLGGRRNLNEDAKDARLCLRDRKLSSLQARDATKQSLAIILEDKNSPLANGPAVGTVIAGLLSHICK